MVKDGWLTWSRVPVQPIMEYRRARRHWPIWWVKPRATMCRFYSRGDGVGENGRVGMLASDFLPDASTAPGLVISTTLLLPRKTLVIVSEYR